MKKISGAHILCLVIAAAALLIGVAACLHIRNTPRENRYRLSDERMFGITNLDEVVETLRGALKDRSARIHISITLQGEYMEDIAPLVRELMDLAYEPTGVPDEGDYLRYQIGGYDLDYSYEEADGEYSYRLVLTPDYYSSQEEEQKVNEAVKEIIESFGFDSQTGDYEKIKAVFDWVCKNVRYDSVKSRLGSSHYKSSAYGALFYKNAVCQGYSVLMYRLLRECGINCRIVTGIAEREGESELHAWNIAELDGRYYNIDASWCSQLETEDYFLKSDEDMEGHTKDEKFLTEEFCEDFQISKVSYR